MGNLLLSEISPIDSHCHLFDDKFDEDRDKIIAQTLKKLEGIIVILEEPDVLTKKPLIFNPRIKYSAGYHPYYAEKANNPEYTDIIKQLSKDKIISAIGEIGLDYYHCEVSREIQIKAFEIQLNIANSLNLPVIIHSRNAEDDTYEILKNFRKTSNHNIVLHCYGGNIEKLPKFIDLGCYISFAGNITYPKADNLRECVRLTPMESLLVETDAPYLAPQPVRGKRCLPEYVLFTLEEVARTKRKNIKDIVEQTNQNAKLIFGLYETSTKMK